MTSPLYTPKNSPDWWIGKMTLKVIGEATTFLVLPAAPPLTVVKITLEYSRSKPYGTKQVKHKTLLEMWSRKHSVTAVVLQVFQVDAKKSKWQKMTEQKQCLAARGR